jgi:hypothetical protein
MLWLGAGLLIIVLIIRTYLAYYYFHPCGFFWVSPHILSSATKRLVFAAIWLVLLAVSETILFVRGGWIWGIGGLIFIFIVGPTLFSPIILRVLHHFGLVLLVFLLNR